MGCIAGESRIRSGPSFRVFSVGWVGRAAVQLRKEVFCFGSCFLYFVLCFRDVVGLFRDRRTDSEYFVGECGVGHGRDRAVILLVLVEESSSSERRSELLFELLRPLVRSSLS